MTEDEAKTKWCPFVRLMTAGGRDNSGNPTCPQPQTTFNRIGINADPKPWIDDRSRCIGSDCMAWRPVMGGSAKNIATGVVRTLDNGGFYNVRDEEYTPHPVGGYCGLAGKP